MRMWGRFALPYQHGALDMYSNYSNPQHNQKVFYIFSSNVTRQRINHSSIEHDRCNVKCSPPKKKLFSSNNFCHRIIQSSTVNMGPIHCTMLLPSQLSPDC